MASDALQPVLVAGCRTPIGKFQGALASLKATELGAIVVREAVRRAGLRPEQVEEVILGNVLQAGLGQNPARAAALGGGIPETVPAFTVNKVCGSALKAVMLAAQAIKAGDRRVVVAGGMESMTNAPHLLLGSRSIRLGDAKLVDHMIHDGLWDHYNQFHMGETGEIVAGRFKVTRAEADRLAVRSHRRAAEAQKAGRFAQEIVAVPVPQRKGQPLLVAQDEGIREGSDEGALATLRPSFREDGLVTAGNSSQISDGAAAAVVTSKAFARENGLRVLAEIEGYDSSGTRPEWVMEAPIASVRSLLKAAGRSVADVDLFEHNEAFASASCAVQKELGIPDEKFNVSGGAVALGHPIGASGARVLLTLVHELRRRGGGRGVATLCLGGGNAVSMLVRASA
ncbi:MAG TPA: acetyl-CoA C-acetyltransferase [Candidatus Thermoplasmatota archaeon]|nr:acetyl-CoA C-acetyltransferase [Candidatus Thermoplasmatota archaeon]